MIKNAAYVHTNLSARDWRSLSSFYQRVFGCVPVPPERDYTGAALDATTNLSRAHLIGEHLRLPECGPAGPTLEIFQYEDMPERWPTAVNRPGFGHIAFTGESVERARNDILANGGSAIGEIVTLETSTGARVTWCYVTEPEDNVIEIQSWQNGAVA